MTNETLECTTCKKDVTRRHWVCDLYIDEQFCDECFDQHPCGQGEHGESCPTLVMARD